MESSSSQECTQLVIPPLSLLLKKSAQSKMEMEREAGEEEGKSQEIVEAAEMKEGGDEKEENHGEDVPEKAEEKEMKAAEILVGRKRQLAKEEMQVKCKSWLVKHVALS